MLQAAPSWNGSSGPLAPVFLVDAVAAFLRHCDGGLITKIYSEEHRSVLGVAPRWARDAARHRSSCKGAMRRLIQRAKRDERVRDALIAALDAGPSFVTQLALAQSKK